MPFDGTFPSVDNPAYNSDADLAIDGLEFLSWIRSDLTVENLIDDAGATASVSVDTGHGNGNHGEFNGSSSYAQWSSGDFPTDLRNSTVTIGVLVRHGASVSGLEVALSITDGSAFPEFALGIGSNGRLYTLVRNNTGSILNAEDDGGTLNDDAWHWVVLEYNSSTQQLSVWVDGTQHVGPLSTTGLPSSLYDRLTIGMRDDGSPGNFWNGDIAIVAAWSNADSATIAQAETDDFEELFTALVDAGTSVPESSGVTAVSFDNGVSGTQGALSVSEELYLSDAAMYRGAPVRNVVNADERLDFLFGTGDAGAGYSYLAGGTDNQDNFNIIRDGELLAQFDLLATSAFTKPSTLKDILRGSSFEEEDGCWVPVDFVAFDGCAVIQCQIYEFGGGTRSNASDWDLNTFGAIVVQNGVIEAIRREAYGGSGFSPGGENNIGQAWSSYVTSLDMDGSRDQDAWVAFTNYRLDKDTGGENQTFIWKFTKSSTGSRVPGKLVKLYGETLSGQHFHTAIPFGLSDGGMAVQTRAGDGSVNRVYNHVRADHAYDSGATLQSGSVEVYESPSGWTTHEVAGEDTGDTVAGLYAQCNQGFSVGKAISPAGDPEIVIGPDLELSLIVSEKLPTTVEEAALPYVQRSAFPVHGFSTWASSTNVQGYIGFAGAEERWYGYGRVLIAAIEDNGSDLQDDEETSKLYVYESGHWSTAISGSQITIVQKAAGFAGVAPSTFGSQVSVISSDSVINRFDLGVPKVKRGLMSDPGGTNVLDGVESISGVGSGNVANVNVDIADYGATLSQMPSDLADGTPFHRFNTLSTTSNGIGLIEFDLASNLPDTNGLWSWWQVDLVILNLDAAAATAARYRARASTGVESAQYGDYLRVTETANAVRVRQTVIPLSAATVVSTTSPSTIVVSGDVASEVEASGFIFVNNGSSAFEDRLLKVSSASFSSPNTTIVVEESGFATGTPGGSIYYAMDPGGTFEPQLRFDGPSDLRSEFLMGIEKLLVAPDEMSRIPIPRGETQAAVKPRVNFTGRSTRFTALVSGRVPVDCWDGENRVLRRTDPNKTFATFIEENGEGVVVRWLRLEVRFGAVNDANLFGVYKDETTGVTQNLAFGGVGVRKGDGVLFGVYTTGSQLVARVSYGNSVAQDVNIIVFDFAPNAVLLGHRHDGTGVVAWDFFDVQHTTEDLDAPDLSAMTVGGLGGSGSMPSSSRSVPLSPRSVFSEIREDDEDEDSDE